MYMYNYYKKQIKKKRLNLKSAAFKNKSKKKKIFLK